MCRHDRAAGPASKRAAGGQHTQMQVTSLSTVDVVTARLRSQKSLKSNKLNFVYRSFKTDTGE